MMNLWINNNECLNQLNNYLLIHYHHHIEKLTKSLQGHNTTFHSVTLNNVWLFKNIHTKFQYLIMCSISVTHTSEIYMTAMLVMLMVTN
jgi:hypothetical protein